MIPLAWAGLKGWPLIKAVLKACWPALAVLAALVAIYIYGQRQHSRGVAETKATYAQRARDVQKAADELVEVATAAMHEAELEAERARGEIRVITNEVRTERETHYASPAADNGVALGAERVRAAESGLARLAAAARAGVRPDADRTGDDAR